ncbi:MAG: hypothetical protein CVV27_05710 [Candidatus Melainabacteria bacterium HGW-Melainabacteria-1]|nr:MAG: hypothetical protein CVV27_05710 [Candidatus Melainabacteria bacterium HGW-Melainabacteria-1]
MTGLWPALLGRMNQYLGIRARDWPLLLLMLAHVFAALTLTISLRSLNTGLLLAAFEPSVFPWYFLAEAVLSFVLSMGYGAIAHRISRRRENIGLLIVFAGILLAGRLLLFQGQAWVNFALPVICEAFSGLVMIQAWILYGDCVDSRKARRVFPLIGLGGTCGGIFGGWLASRLAHLIGTENLLFIELILLGLLCLGSLKLLKRATDPEQKMEHKLEQASEVATGLVARGQQVLTSVMANKLLVRVLGILVCVRVASTILDFQLQLQLKAHFSQDGITAYMGTYFALTSLVTLIIQLTLENRIINSHGVVWGMGSTPLTLGLGLGGFLLAPSLMSATIAKFFEQITKNSLFKTAVELVYIPFESSVRRRLRVMVNGILSLTTVPLASVTIMVFSGQALILVLIALAFAGLGLVISILLQGPYTRKLHDALMRRRLLIDDNAGRLQQQLSVSPDAIERLLTRGGINMILFALELLKQQNIPISPNKLDSLFFHPNPYVREGALHLLARQGSTQHAQLAVDILTHDRDPRVRRACFAALRRLGDESLNPILQPFLDDPSLEVRAECVLFLFTKGGIEGILAGAEVLKAWTESSSEHELEMAAYAIGQIGIRYFRSDYLALLRHPVAQVRQAALEAGGVSLPAELMQELLPALAERAHARATRQALLTLPADQVLPAAMQSLRAHGNDISRQLELIKLMSGFQHPLAVDYLMELLAEPDIRIKHQVLQGLVLLRRKLAYDPEPYKPRVHAQLQREFYYGYHYYLLLTLLRKHPGDPVRGRFLQAEIKYKLRFVQEMIFRLLGLLHPPDEIYKAFLNFRSQSAHFRALSLEVLSYTLDSELLELVLSFLDDLPYDHKLAVAREHLVIDETIGNQWWASAVILEDPWLRRLSVWCRHLEPPEGEERQMFEILDKMFLLKQTPVFEKFSAEQIYPVAAAAREQFVPSQTLIFKQGQPGDAFYIVSSGTVAVERSGVRVTLLGEKECFGELEVLNGEPRLAAIRTVSECELLVISREDFIDLVEEYPDFSRGLLEVLSERLAAHVLKLSRTQPLGTGSLWSESSTDVSGIGIDYKPQN